MRAANRWRRNCSISTNSATRVKSAMARCRRAWRTRPGLGSAGHTADYVESPGKLPALVIESVREFAKPEYGVDLLKLESPLAADHLPYRDGSMAAVAAQREFDA